MPTVLILQGFRFFFFSNDRNEPIHIHVEKENSVAKFWLVPYVEFAKSKGFNSVELNKIQKLVEENSDFLKSKWNEYFNG
jgi:hypothetical protein